MGLLSHTWIGCLLAFLPGPPRVKFYNAQFRLFPVDKTNKYCPEVQPERDVGFYLFSREYPEKPQKLRIGDDVALASSYLDFRLPIVIYFPPFFDGIDSRNVREIKQAYLKKGGCNFLVVGSERLNAGPWYPTAVTNTFIVGKYTAAFLDYLLLKGFPIKNLHLLGLSIGAHAAGVAGRYMKLGKPPRITGLDPASLLFTKKHRDMRLDKSDADFVDVIHTDRTFGMFYPIGHADFFVNPDVYPQPGCKIRDIFTQFKGVLPAVFCSHLRSNELFAMSVFQPTAFPGRKCLSWRHLQLGLCGFQFSDYMGFGVSANARGVYFLLLVRFDSDQNWHLQHHNNILHKNLQNAAAVFQPVGSFQNLKYPKAEIFKQGTSKIQNK